MLFYEFQQNPPHQFVGGIMKAVVEFVNHDNVVILAGDSGHDINHAPYSIACHADGQKFMQSFHGKI